MAYFQVLYISQAQFRSIYQYFGHGEPECNVKSF
jgi:hypothetical protein